MWLEYLLDALLPCLDRVTVTYPDFPAYDALVERARSQPDRLRLRPVTWRSDKLSWPDTLERGDVTDADLVLVTWLDVILKKYRGDLRRQLGAPIWGLWYLPARPEAASFWNPRRLISGQARGHYREQRVLRRVPTWLDGALVLDDLLARRITPRPGLRIEVLPDPWPTQPDIDQIDARQRLRLPPEKTLFLHFGVANPRKGLLDAASAWERLRDRPDAVLVRAGMTLAGEVQALEALVGEGRAILRNERIPDADVDLYFRACDWVLVPYRQHEGSSGLLSGAAAARRPLIASDYAVIGHRVRQQGLGLWFPHESVDGLLDAVRDALHTPIDRFSAALTAYAESHNLAHFYSALRNALGLTVNL